MSRENEAIVRRVIAAMNARDLDGYLACCSANVELLTPAVDGIYERREGIRRWFADVEETGPDFRLDIQGLEAIGGDRVVASLRACSTGRASGIPLATEVTNVYDLIDGKVSRIRIYFDRAEALKAVGLEE